MHREDDGPDALGAAAEHFAARRAAVRAHGARPGARARRERRRREVHARLELRVEAEARLDGAPVEEWNYLDQFYKKYNKVLLDKFALSKEREGLERQNEDLRLILKQYLDGVSVNEEVMAGTNSLLVLNDKLQLNVPVGSRREAPATVVEAAHNVVSTTRQRIGAPPAALDH